MRWKTFETEKKQTILAVLFVLRKENKPPRHRKAVKPGVAGNGWPVVTILLIVGSRGGLSTVLESRTAKHGIVVCCSLSDAGHVRWPEALTALEGKLRQLRLVQSVQLMCYYFGQKRDIEMEESE